MLSGGGGAGRGRTGTASQIDALLIDALTFVPRTNTPSWKEQSVPFWGFPHGSLTCRHHLVSPCTSETSRWQLAGPSPLQAASGAPVAPSHVGRPLALIAAKVPHGLPHSPCRNMAFRKLKTCFSHKYGVKTRQKFSPTHSRVAREMVGPAPMGLRGAGTVHPSGRTF